MGTQLPRLPIDLEKVRQEYREGRSLRAIAQDYGYSHVHISRMLTKLGEPKRPHTNPEIQQRMREAKAKKVQLQREAAICLCKNGMQPQDVAVVLGHNLDWVRGILKEEGIYVA